ncbi:MAG: spore coat protein [Firmicutes bacterium]|nr:spore coat protein [Bacillota bacterium]
MPPENPGSGMTDLDRVKDYLLTCKYLTGFYDRAAQECTNPGVRELFLQIHGQEQHDQEVAFSFLTVRGAYPVAFATPERLQAERERWQEVAAGLPAEVGRPGVGPETRGERPTPGITAGPGAPDARQAPPPAH